MDDNLEQIVDMAKQAKEWGANISFSSYSIMKANNEMANNVGIKMSILFAMYFNISLNFRALGL